MTRENNFKLKVLVFVILIVACVTFLLSCGSSKKVVRQVEKEAVTVARIDSTKTETVKAETVNRKTRVEQVRTDNKESVTTEIIYGYDSVRQKTFPVKQIITRTIHGQKKKTVSTIDTSKLVSLQESKSQVKSDIKTESKEKSKAKDVAVKTDGIGSIGGGVLTLAIVALVVFLAYKFIPFKWKA